jgi:TatA/E family protein of Tat protein translocase
MGPIGVQEMVVIFLVALVLFGPKKLPELGKTLAKAVTEFRRAQSDLKATFEREMQSLERETESLREATRQAAVDLTNYGNIDVLGSSSNSSPADQNPYHYPPVSASAVSGAESFAELMNSPEGTVPRGSSESTVVEASSAAPDESNPLPEFEQTDGKAAKPADAELPSIV